MTGRRSRLTARRRKVRFVAGLAGSFFVCAVLWLALVVLTSTALLGWRPVVLHSGSMAPLLEEGDVLLAEPVGDDVRPGTVIVFHDPEGRGLLTHRAVGRNDDGTYRTRGDANPSEDTLGVAPEDIVGRGRLLVPWLGRPLVWLHAGSWLSVAAAALAFAGSLRLAKYGLLRHYDPWAPPTYSVYRAGQWILVDRRSRWRRRRPLIGSVTAAAMVACLVLGASTIPRDAHAAFTSKSSNGPDTWAAAPFFPRYLHSDGSGVDQASSEFLPLDHRKPTFATLVNYDTDLDGAAGRLIVKGGTVATKETNMQQTWLETMPDDFTVTGTAQLHVWSASKAFNTTKSGKLTGFLLDCSAPRTCTTVASVTYTAANWSGGSTTWVQHVVDFGPISHTFAAGHSLGVKLVVPDLPGEDVWLAYDTTAYPSRLTVG